MIKFARSSLFINWDNNDFLIIIHANVHRSSRVKFNVNIAFCEDANGRYSIQKSNNDHFQP